MYASSGGRFEFIVSQRQYFSKEKQSRHYILGQCGLHLTVLFGILRQWSISQAPRVTATSVASYGSLKWTGYTGDHCFFSLWMVKQIHRNRRWDVNMIMPFTRSKSSYLTAEERENNKKKRKSRRKMEQRYSSDSSSLGPAVYKGLLWLVRTNKAVWEHSGAADWRPLVPIIVKSRCLCSHIHTATSVHIQH